MKYDLCKKIMRISIIISFGVMKLVFACSSSTEDTNENNNISNRSSVFIFEDDTEWGDGYFENDSKLDCETPIFPNVGYSFRGYDQSYLEGVRAPV